MAYSLPYQSLLILNLHSFCFSLSLRHSFTLQGPSTSHIIHISYKYKQSIPRIQRVEARPATGAMEALLSASRAKNKVQPRRRVEALPRWFLFGRFLRPANLPTCIFLKRDYKCCAVAIVAIVAIHIGELCAWVLVGALGAKHEYAACRIFLACPSRIVAHCRAAVSRKTSEAVALLLNYLRALRRQTNRKKGF